MPGISSQFDQVAWAEVTIEQEPWVRIPVDGSPHPHSFTRGGSCTRLCTVRLDRGSEPVVSGGLRGLEVIKTTGSGFAGFFRDPYTTLADTTDRIFATRIDATWKYVRGHFIVRGGLRDGALRAAGGVRPARQRERAADDLRHGEALLARLPRIASVSITMPNQHRLLVNLEQFGMDNPNEIFVATREPYGLIKGTVARDGKWEG